MLIGNVPTLTAQATSPILAALGIGIALASAPGPVQAVLLAEAVRGGVRRGVRALAGSTFTFGCLLVALALGLSVAPPSDAVLRILEVAGGGLLLWLAVDAVRSGHGDGLDPGASVAARRTLHPTARGALAIIFNPGAWLFLASVASPLLGSATNGGGQVGALLAAFALLVGAALGDLGVVLIGGIGLRRAGQRVVLWAQRILAALLAGLGIWLMINAALK